METRQLAFSSSLVAFAILAAATLAPVASAAAYSVQLTRVGPATVLASPGETVTITANVTNTGTSADTYTLTIYGDGRYSPVLPVSSISLDAGTSLDVVYQVTTPANWYRATFALNVRSQSEPNMNREIQTTVETPIVVTVTPNDTRLTLTGQSVTGVVTVTYLNGQPHVGASVLVQAHADTPTSLKVPGTAKTYVTNAQGSFAYDLGQAAIDHTPGSHTIIASTARPGASPATGSASYRV